MITTSRGTAPTVGDIVRSLLRHSKKAFLVFCLVLLLTVSWIVFMPEEYRSLSKIYVRVGRETTTLDPSATTGTNIHVDQTFESKINSMLEILDSQSLAEKVVDEIGFETILKNDLPDSQGSSKLAASPETSVASTVINWTKDLKQQLLPKRFEEDPRQRAIRTVSKNSYAWAPKNSNVIEIGYQCSHPKLAQDVAAALTDAFVDEHLRVTKTEGSLNFFVHQTESLKAQVETIEEDLAELKDTCELVSIPGQTAILEEESKTIRSKMLTNQTLLDSGKARISELEKSLNVIPERVQTDQRTAEKSDGWFALRDRLFDLQIREQELLSRFAPDNPEVQAIVEQRKAAAKILAEQQSDTSELVTSTNPTYLQIQQLLWNEKAQVVALLAEKQILAQQLESNLNDFKTLNSNALKIADLERQRSILVDSYLASSRSAEQAKTLAGLEKASISSIGVLQPASFDVRPVGLGRSKTLMLGVMLGMVLGLATMFVFEYFDRSFATATQVENALDVPVLVSIPRGRRQLMEVG